MKNLNFFVQSKFLQIYLFLLQNLVLKVAYLYYSMVLEQIVVLLVDPSHVSVLLLLVDLEILAPFWATSSASTLLIFAPAYKRFVVLD
jgi:hypothetical protein